MKKAKVIVGLFAVLTLSFTSCITIDNTLGSALIPSNQDISIHTVQFDLPVDLRMADSLNTSVANSITVGALRTDTYGLFRSDGAFTITPLTDSIVWGKEATITNAFLSFTIDSVRAMKADQKLIPQNFHIYQLNFELDSTYIYNNCITEKDYNPTPISKGNIFYTGDETLVVQVDKDWANRLLSFSMEELDSTELFMKKFYGLYISCDNPEDGMEGGRLNYFDLSSSYLNIEYSYRKDDGTLNGNSAMFYLGDRYCVNICSSESGYLESDEPGNILYMESLCGIKPHIDAKKLKNMLDEWASANDVDTKTLIVAKASMEFPFEYSGDPAQFNNYPGNLFPCRKTKVNDKIAYTPISDIQNSTASNGSINRSLLYFKPDANAYIQNLIKADKKDIDQGYDLWLMPTLAYTSSSTSSTSYYPDYYFYTQCEINGPTALRHPVLKLTYTNLK